MVNACVAIVPRSTVPICIGLMDVHSTGQGELSDFGLDIAVVNLFKERLKNLHKMMRSEIL